MSDLPPQIGPIGASPRIWSDGAELLRHKSSSRRATHEGAPHRRTSLTKNPATRWPQSLRCQVGLAHGRDAY